jgi:transcriptional regulator with XRE-family HTH domain
MCSFQLRATNIRDHILLQNVGQRIKEVRLARNITQEEFYFDTKINSAQIEAGKLNTSICALSTISENFELALSSFFLEVNL